MARKSDIMWKRILKSESLASIGSRLERLDAENEDGTYQYRHNHYDKVPKELEDKVIDMIKNKKYTDIKDDASEFRYSGDDETEVYFKVKESGRHLPRNYLVRYVLLKNQTYTYNGEHLVIAKENNYSDDWYGTYRRGYDRLVTLSIKEKEGQPRLIED